MRPEVGICAISTYVPERRLDLSRLAGGFGVGEDFLDKKTGYRRLARKDPDQETSDLAQRAAMPLFDTRPDLKDTLGLLVVVTQNPDGFGLPHTSAVLHGKLGLPSTVAAFDVSLGCSGWVYGLSVAKAFMEGNDLDHGLLITADPYSKVIDPADKNTMLLFGDAAAATLLGREGVRWQLGKFVFGTDGRRADNLQVGPHRKLAMNGTGVFTFSATRVPECVRRAMAINGIEAAEVDRVLLHQGSRYVVDTIGMRLGMPEKTPFDSNDVGNTVSSTIPMLLSRPEFSNDHTIVVCGFGVGLSWGATVLTSLLA